MVLYIGGRGNDFPDANFRSLAPLVEQETQ
jgi:hypothetical protein